MAFAVVYTYGTHSRKLIQFIAPKFYIAIVSYIEGILPKGPFHHAYAWQIGPFWQDTLGMSTVAKEVY